MKVLIQLLQVKVRKYKFISALKQKVKIKDKEIIRKKYSGKVQTPEISTTVIKYLYFVTSLLWWTLMCYQMFREGGSPFQVPRVRQH